MKQKQLIKIFPCKLSGHLSPIQLDQIRKELNLFHYGHEDIPLEVSSENLDSEHVEAHWKVNRGFEVDVWIDYYSDGGYKIRLKNQYEK